MIDPTVSVSAVLLVTPTALLQPVLSWPLAGGAGVATQEFGGHALDYSKFGLIGHNGLDIGAPVGTPVVATHGGECWVYDDPAGYGLTVEVWAPEVDNASAYKTIYGHLSEQIAVCGQRIEAGMVLGLVGSTGNSTGPHLHFGIKLLQGKNPGYLNWVDPRSFMCGRHYLTGAKLSDGGKPADETLGKTA